MYKSRRSRTFGTIFPAFGTYLGSFVAQRQATGLVGTTGRIKVKLTVDGAAPIHDRNAMPSDLPVGQRMVEAAGGVSPAPQSAPSWL